LPSSASQGGSRTNERRSDTARVYFARAVDGLDGAHVARLAEEARQILEAVGLSMVDPVASEPAFPDAEVNGAVTPDPSQFYRQIVEHDLAMLRGCDAVLMDMTIPSRNYIGCICEMMYAYIWDIPCVVYLGRADPNRPWLRYHATAMFAARSEAVAYLARHFSAKADR
jgi:hypothetical protein